ncbi:MAG: hypothetical protein MZW92_53130 [Comamonadaceae bacterium]|nr:hypothetical protein [Comamonadaceae bacterium]
MPGRCAPRAARIAESLDGPRRFRQRGAPRAHRPKGESDVSACAGSLGRSRGMKIGRLAIGDRRAAPADRRPQRRSRPRAPRLGRRARARSSIAARTRRSDGVQGLLRQGQPLLARQPSAAPAWTRACEILARGEARDSALPVAHRRARARAGAGRRRGRRRAPDPGLPVPPDRPARGARGATGRAGQHQEGPVPRARATWRNAVDKVARDAATDAHPADRARHEPSATTTSSSTCAALRPHARASRRSASTRPTPCSIPAPAGNRPAGDRRFVAPLARAAVAVGLDALFVEVHPEPERAPCDGPSQIDFASFRRLLAEVCAVDAALRALGEPETL